MNPRVDAGVHVRNVVVREVPTHSDTDTGHDQPRQAARRQVQHRHEQAEEHDGRTQVLLEYQNTQAHEPGQEHRCKVAQSRQVYRTDAAARHQNQVAVRCQVTGEENRQRNLRDLAGLEGAVADVNPDARTVQLHAQAGNQRHDEQNHRQHQGGVRDLAQHAVVAQHEHDDRAQHHGHARPHELAVAHRRGNLRVQTVNHRQTDTVQSHHQRQDERVGVAGTELQDQVDQERTGAQHDGAGKPLALRSVQGVLRVDQVHAERANTHGHDQQ